MHDDDPFAAFNEPHDFQLGDRVEAVEGSGIWRVGARRGIVLQVDKTLGRIMAETAAEYGQTPQAVADEAAKRGVALAYEWAAERLVIEVVFDDVEEGSPLAGGDGKLICLPVHLIRTGTIFDR